MLTYCGNSYCKGEERKASLGSQNDRADMTLHVAKSCLLPPLHKPMEDKRYSDYVLDHYNNTTGTRHGSSQTTNSTN